MRYITQISGHNSDWVVIVDDDNDDVQWFNLHLKAGYRPA